MAKKTSPVNKTTTGGVEQKDGIQRSAISEQVLGSRDLVWARQHPRAIDLPTQGLSRSDCQSDPRQSEPRKAEYRSGRLDLRAESYMAIGKLALGARDTMMGLAKLSRTGEFNGGQR